jgi:2-polyprenyl-3-methyl-5-hydroxy-6-metoxy-1,4-benzoquinol methylase
MMSKDTLLKFLEDPLGFVKRVFHKTVTGPLKYGKGNDYDSYQYWHDRFSKYGLSLRSAGDEGLREKENERMYAEAARVFIDLCQREDIDFENVHALEIGCGTGFYTKLLHDLGVKNYVGVDITDIFFSELRTTFPHFKFAKKDITLDQVKGEFDLIVMIDVIEHIVNEDKLSCSMNNVKACLRDGGVFILAPIASMSRRHLFYLRSWALEDIKRRFTGHIFSELVPFRSGYIVVIRKP